MTVNCKLPRAVIRSAVKDLGSSDVTAYKSALKYLNSAIFSVDCENAGYPTELRDSLKEMVLLSQTQRIFLSQNVLRILKENWDEKNPAGAGL